MPYIYENFTQTVKREMFIFFHLQTQSKIQHPTHINIYLKFEKLHMSENSRVAPKKTQTNLNRVLQ